MIFHEIQIGDLGKIITGKTPPTSDSENYNGMIPFITPVDLNGRRNIFLTERYISDKGKDTVKNCLLPKDSVCVSCIGSDMGKAAVTTCPSVTNQQINSIIVNSQYNHLYVYYLMCTLEQTIKSLGKNGTAIPILNKSKFSSIKIRVPELSDQVRVANILSAYDDLIENNQKQIKLLEEAAQRLYKEWFIDLRFPGHESTPIHDGIPEGWEKRSMDDIADYLNGYAFKPDDWGPDGMPIIKIKELNDGITKDTPRNTGESIPAKYVVHPGEILFSWSATLTAKIWDSETGLLNQHLFKVTPTAGITREFVLQSILKTLDEFRNLTTGSTMKHIQRGKLKEVSVIVPSDEMMNQYSEKSEPIRERIMILRKQNDLLIEARDRLLPKLMSGEIEV